MHIIPETQKQTQTFTTKFIRLRVVYNSSYKKSLTKNKIKWDTELFHDGGPYHIEISPLIWKANHESVNPLIASVALI